MGWARYSTHSRCKSAGNKLHVCNAGAEPAADSPKALVCLPEARKLAAPILASTANVAAATAPSAKAGKAVKADPPPGPIPAEAAAGLKQAAETCEAVMLKLSSASSLPGSAPHLKSKDSVLLGC